MTHVIRWDIAPKSYFRHMTALGPSFGAGLADTPRFNSAREAQQTIDLFPTVAAAGSAIVEVES